MKNGIVVLFVGFLFSTMTSSGMVGDTNDLSVSTAQGTELELIDARIANCALTVTNATEKIAHSAHLMARARKSNLISKEEILRMDATIGAAQKVLSELQEELELHKTLRDEFAHLSE